MMFHNIKCSVASKGPIVLPLLVLYNILLHAFVAFWVMLNALVAENLSLV